MQITHLWDMQAAFVQVSFAFYGGRENLTRCNFRKLMQTEKTPANQENNFINLTAGAANAHKKK